MAQDFYQTLGVSKSASAEEIKRAYRKLAHQYHPDKGSGGDAAKFKEVSEAYQVLSNPQKRAQYDQFGSAYSQAGGFGQGAQGFGGFDFSNFAQGFGGVEFEDAFDIFSDMFGGGRTRSRPRRQRGVDLEMSLKLEFEEAVFGVEKELTLEKVDSCPTCEGSGAAPGSKVITCPKCHGTGQIRTSRQTIFGQMASVATCDQCDGTGKVPERACSECKGTGQKKRQKTIKVKIPAGVEDGTRIRISGEGEVGYRGSSAGDLYLSLRVAPSKKFQREGSTIYSDISISIYQAALGTTVEVETVDGRVKMKIPAGTQSEKVFRLKSHGAHIINSKERGDHLVTVHVATPTKLTKKEKELFKQLADERGESVEVDESFWSKLTS